MRRIVRDHVAIALRRQAPDLERFIAQHLEVGDSFPLDLAEPAVSINDIGRLRIVPRYSGDFPEVDIVVTLSVRITGMATRREAARGVRTAAVPEGLLGRRTFAIDVELTSGFAK